MNEDNKNMDDAKIKVGEKEFSQEELNQLVGLGESVRDLESKWNTKIDSLMPAYTKTTQELAELRKKENDWLREKEELGKPAPTEDERDEATKKAEALKILKEQFGVLTKEDYEADFRNRYQIERQAERLNGQLTDLETKIDGSDGRPKFDSNDILSFMKQSNIADPEMAYKIKNEKALDDWKTIQFQSVKKNGIITNASSSAGSKQPAPVKVTKDNLIDAIKEVMGS